MRPKSPGVQRTAASRRRGETRRSEAAHGLKDHRRCQLSAALALTSFGKIQLIQAPQGASFVVVAARFRPLKGKDLLGSEGEADKNIFLLV